MTGGAAAVDDHACDCGRLLQELRAQRPNVGPLRWSLGLIGLYEAVVGRSRRD